MIWHLARSIREYRKDSVLAPIFMVLEVTMEVIIPLLMAGLIDFGIDAGDMSFVLRRGIVLVVFCILSLTFGALSGRHAARAAAGFAANLRRDMYHNVQDFSFSNLDRFSTAGLITRLTTDVSYVQNAFMVIVRIAVRAPLMLGFALVMAFSINAEIAVVFLYTVPLMGLGLYLIMSRAHPWFRRVFRTYDRLNRAVQENLRGIRVVKSFAQQEEEIRKFTSTSADIHDHFCRAEKLLAFNMPLMQFCMYSCTLLAAWMGARLIVGGTMTTGQLVGIITYAMQILMSLMMLSMVFVMVTISRASAERITEVLAESSDLRVSDEPVTGLLHGDITFEDVGFSYAADREKLCLSGVNLHISSGEVVGIIGSTGSSKTTLVQLIPRLYDVTGGRLTVGGEDVRDYDVEVLRRDVAMVLQKNVLFSGTVRENLRWGNSEATDEEMVHACQLAQAHDFVSELPGGYDAHIEQGGANLSGGQRQRLCIARALLKAPRILILDDSTSAVDTGTEALILRAFRESIPDTTRIIITQRLSSLQDADQIVVMDDGRVDAVGRHEELLRENVIYRDIYRSQLRGGDFDAAAGNGS